MNTEPETRRIQATLKPLLKSRGYSYPILARELGVSVPTVKRMLTGDDISVERLVRLCGILGMQLQELFELTASGESDLYVLSPEEEEYFAKHPNYLFYLRALYSERLAPREIEKATGISRKCSVKYISQLTKMGLIYSLPNGQIKVRIQGLIAWNDHGPLGKVLSHEKIQKIVDRNLRGTAVDRYHELGGRLLLPAEYEAMKTELRAVVAKYRRVSKTNSSSKDLSKMRRYQFVIMAERRMDNDLQRITSVTRS